jgi:hypothetical protein
MREGYSSGCVEVIEGWVKCTLCISLRRTYIAKHHGLMYSHNLVNCYVKTKGGELRHCVNLLTRNSELFNALALHYTIHGNYM